MSILGSLLGLAKRTDEAERSGSDAKANDSAAPVGVSERLRPFLVFMEGMAESLATERIQELTLREAVTRFVEGKPVTSQPAKGALIVQPHRDGKLVLWTFLDGDDRLMCDETGKPLGRKAICASLDEELAAILKDKELLIIE